MISLHRSPWLLVLFAAAPIVAQEWRVLSPGWRYDLEMAFDWGRGLTVLFGGSPNNETWEYDGDRWTLVAPAVSPPARRSHAMAYDTRRNRTVLFGGEAILTGTLLQDAWEYDGSTWTPLPNTTSLPAGECTAAFDFHRGRTV